MLVGAPDQDQLNAVARFLDARDMKAEALQIATDPDYRFDLAGAQPASVMCFSPSRVVYQITPTDLTPPLYKKGSTCHVTPEGESAWVIWSPSWVL